MHFYDRNNADTEEKKTNTYVNASISGPVSSILDISMRFREKEEGAEIQFWNDWYATFEGILRGS